MFRFALLVTAVLAATGGAVRAATERAALKVPVCQRTTSQARPYVRVVVRTAVRAGYHAEQHAEGIVVSTTLKGGQIEPNHIEGVVG